MDLLRRCLLCFILATFLKFIKIGIHSFINLFDFLLVALEEDEMKLEWASTTPLSSATSLQAFNAYLIDKNIGECGEMFTWRGRLEIWGLEQEQLMSELTVVRK